MATVKQRIAIKEITENHSSVRAAMIKAGYSPNTYVKPQNLTASKVFREYLDQAGVTDDKLAKVLDEGLGATRAVVMGVKSDDSFVDIQPDYNTRHKYLETGLKLKGHFTSEPDPTNINVNIINFVRSTPARLSAEPKTTDLP